MVQVIEVQLQRMAKLGRVDIAWEFGIIMRVITNAVQMHQM